MQYKTGDEGKTWFQGYLETLYGYARVVRLELKMKTGNVLKQEMYYMY